MPFDFSPSWMDSDLETFAASTARFVETEVLPDDDAARKRGSVGHQIWRRAGELRMLCTDIPEEFGGGGGDFRHEAIVIDQLCRRGLTGMSTSVHSIVAHYVLNHGTPSQKQRFLPRLASGEIVGAIAMTEPGAGSDLQGIRTRALPEGNQYVLNGTKTFITNGALAGVVLVVAKTDPAQGARGISIMIVETENREGYKVGRVLDKMGLKAQDTSELFFDDVRVPAEDLLGGVEGQGFFQLMSDLPYERLMIAVGALSAIEGAYEATLAYVRDRKAFGKPIAELQNTKFKLANVATIAKVGRAFVDRCITNYLAGKLDTATASMAKLWLSEEQGKAIDECVQLFGGYGYMNEYLVTRMYADARIQRIYGGTSEIMREVIARAM
jgi:acyl-CoA dehydrogenase